MLETDWPVGQASNAYIASAPEQVSRVYVIDDDLQIRRSLHFLLATAGFVSWPFASASDFLGNLPDLEPAPILLDVRMPTIGGIELMSMLVERGIRWPTIVMTAHADIPVAVQSVKLGAIEFLEKPFDFEALDASLNEAMAQLTVMNNLAEIQSSSHNLFDLLSPREIEVLMVLMDGRPNKAAAHRLSLGVRTIEMHHARALQKLKVRSIAEVIRLASMAGIKLAPSKQPACAQARL